MRRNTWSRQPPKRAYSLPYCWRGSRHSLSHHHPYIVIPIRQSEPLQYNSARITLRSRWRLPDSPFTSSTAVAGTVPLLCLYCCYARTNCAAPSSIGMALTDTLDDLISERRIEPQLAMKILANFDRSITEVLADKVKARLTFKVLLAGCGGKVGWQANEILY
jgi:hypothetical protein